ncbi:hypothetical protein JCGZ_03961 [Jatropha curcas]|uniref:Uncharacterized protein n=1 Tax=Jatropha curcas TaxID=180498 RepID=A0A067JKW1_JATCU|nr:hypothetical protein JCGZ_03961 [Jatropha curcas]
METIGALPDIPTFDAELVPVSRNPLTPGTRPLHPASSVAGFGVSSPVPTQRYQEICQRFGFARSYIGRLYSERHELELENGRLRRHQSRQSSAVSRLQAEDQSSIWDDTACSPSPQLRERPDNITSVD